MPLTEPTQPAVLTDLILELFYETFFYEKHLSSPPVKASFCPRSRVPPAAPAVSAVSRRTLHWSRSPRSAPDPNLGIAGAGVVPLYPYVSSVNTRCDV